MSRMFSNVRTFNPVVGCTHSCQYCWARRLAETRLKHLPQYKDGFKPYLVTKELNRRFKGGTILVSSMGDLFCEGVDAFWIESVLKTIEQSPDATFYLLTKNPRRYRQFIGSIPENVICGATIETNYVEAYISNAPMAKERFRAMERLKARKFISIEPIMNFNLTVFANNLQAVEPEFIYIGMDNYGHHLPEPPLAKTQELIKRLKGFVEVREKTTRKAWDE